MGRFQDQNWGSTCHYQRPFHFHHWPSSFHLLHACLLQSPHLVMAIKSPPSGHHSALLRARSIDCFKYQTKRQLKKHGMGRLARSAKRNDRATAVLQGSSKDLLLQWTPIFAKNLDAQHPALGDTLQAMMSLPSSMNKPLIAISLVTERSLVIRVGALALKFDRETPKIQNSPEV